LQKELKDVHVDYREFTGNVIAAGSGVFAPNTEWSED
jgi:hypothetical protein